MSIPQKTWKTPEKSQKKTHRNFEKKKSGKNYKKRKKCFGANSKRRLARCIIKVTRHKKRIGGSQTSQG